MSKKDVQECRTILRELLSTTNEICLCSENGVCYLDDMVARHLRHEHKKFLVCDISQGYQVGGYSEGALCHFASNGEVFDNPNIGRFKIKVSYGPFSVRYFEAWPVEYPKGTLQITNSKEKKS